MIDYSFIRLLDDFSKAKDLQESPLAKNSYYNQVHLLTSEAYLQITNTPNGLSFQSDYTANLVDCSNEVIEDVTGHVFISEFTSSTGLQQIAFEIVNLPTDHGYKVLFLRIESNTNPNYVFWSSPFICTEDSKELTTRYDYWSNSYYEGIDYTVSQKKQSIRLSTYFNQYLDSNEIDPYYRITTGQTVGSRALLKRFDQYNVEQFNGYFLRRLDVLLTHDHVYIDCIASEYSQPLEYTERIELSNMIETTFSVSKDDSDIFEFEYQIYEGLEVISFVPSGIYTIGNVPVNGIITFNQDVSLEAGEIRLYSEDNTLLKTWSEANLTVIGNSSVQTDDDLNTYANANDTYYFEIDNGLIKSTSNVEYEGIQDSFTWTFTIGDAEYNSLEYNNIQYFT